MKKILFIIVSLFILIPTVSAKEKAVISVFYSDSCVHCKHLHQYLDELSEDSKYNEMFTIDYYEINDSENRELFRKVATYFNISMGVPVYIIGKDVEQGFPNIESDNEQVQESIRKKDKTIKSRIEKAYENQTKNYVNDIKTGKIKVTTTEKTTEAQVLETNEDLQAQVDKNNNKNYLIIGIISIILILIAIIFYNKKTEVKE